MAKKKTEAKKTKRFKARLKDGVGNHREGTGVDGITYKAGEIVESDVDLIKIHPDKFESPAAKQAADYEDVTDEFDGAADAGLVVIKRNRKWYVCGPDGMGDELSGALTKAKATSFVEDQIADAEDAGADDEDGDDEDDEDDGDDIGLGDDEDEDDEEE